MTAAPDPMRNGPMLDAERRDLLLNSYFDNELNEGERSEFERLAAADSLLKEQVALQNRIDDALKSLFAPIDVRLTAPAEDRPVAARLHAPSASAWFRVAAILLLGAIGVAAALLLTRPEYKSADIAYNEHVADQWTPYWTCENDQQFADIGRERGAALVVVPKEGLTLVGWTFRDPVLSEETDGNPGTATLLTTFGGDRVMILMDKATNDRSVRVPEGSGLHVFRRKVGGAVLYEVTPREKPEVLEQFREVASETKARSTQRIVRPALATMSANETMSRDSTMRS